MKNIINIKKSHFERTEIFEHEAGIGMIAEALYYFSEFTGEISLQLEYGCVSSIWEKLAMEVLDKKFLELYLPTGDLLDDELRKQLQIIIHDPCQKPDTYESSIVDFCEKKGIEARFNIGNLWLCLTKLRELADHQKAPSFNEKTLADIDKLFVKATAHPGNWPICQVDLSLLPVLLSLDRYDLEPYFES